MTDRMMTVEHLADRPLVQEEVAQGLADTLLAASQRIAAAKLELREAREAHEEAVHAIAAAGYRQVDIWRLAGLIG